MSFLRAGSKTLVLCLALLTTRFAVSQARYNIFAGVQGIFTDYSIRGSQQPTDLKPGLLLGIGSKIEFENRLYFSPAVFYSFKGYNVTLNQSAYPPNLKAIGNKTGIHSLEIAALLQYDFDQQPSHFFIKAGPILDVQVLGKEKTLLIDGSVVKQNMKYGFAAYGRYAASATLQFGYEFSGDFFGQAFYSHGLTDLNNADAGPAIKYRIAGLTVGKYLQKRKK